MEALEKQDRKQDLKQDLKEAKLGTPLSQTGFLNFTRW